MAILPLLECIISHFMSQPLQGIVQMVYFCRVSILKSRVCWSHFLRSSSQTFHNVILELITKTCAIDMQANTVIREREKERLSAC